METAKSVSISIQEISARSVRIECLEIYNCVIKIHAVADNNFQTYTLLYSSVCYIRYYTMDIDLIS